MTETEFVAKLKKGDFDAFDELVKQFGNQVFNTTISLLQNREDAEDITQEVFAEVFESVKLFNENAKLATWIYRIAVTKSLDHLRKKKAKKRFGFVQSIFGKEGAINKTDHSVFYHPSAQLENKERAAELFKAIDQLPENQRTAFTLHKLEDLSYAEVADIMKLSVSAVESLMVRAKQNLQETLTDYYKENKG